MDVGKWLEISEKFWQRRIGRNWLFKWLYSVTRMSKEDLFFILNSLFSQASSSLSSLIQSIIFHINYRVSHKKLYLVLEGCSTPKL